MKKKNINWWLIIKILVSILIIILIILIAIKILKGKKLNTNDSIVNEVYSYLGQNDLSYCNGLSTYDENKVDFDSLDNKEKICNSLAELYKNDDRTLMKIDKTKKNNTCSINDSLIFATDNYEEDTCSIYRLEKEKVADKYKTIYGQELKDHEEFQLNNTTICYPDDEYYYCGLSETFTVTIGAEPETFRSIKEATKKGNKIVIYDYFIKVVNDECYTSYTGNTTNSNCTSEYKDNQDINYEYLKKYGTLYKHTFKKGNDGKYYWVQSEPN